MKVGYFAIALVSILITLVGFEIAIRLFGGPRVPPKIYPSRETRLVDGGRIFCPDPKVTRPYFAHRRRYPGCVFYPSNNAGLRNLFDVRARDPRRLRIVGMGDSMVFGYGVDHEDTFLYLLHESLNDRLGAGRAEVINAARPGYDLADSYRLLTRQVLGLHPDLVLLGLHLNDFLKFPTQPVRRPRDHPLRKYLHLVDLLLFRWELAESGDINEREALASYDAKTRARLFDQLRAFESTLAERDTRLLVLIFPLFVKLDDYPFRRIHQELREFLASERIDYIDFLRDFTGKRGDLYWITLDDQHPNERAHQVFFERVSERVDEILQLGSTRSVSGPRWPRARAPRVRSLSVGRSDRGGRGRRPG